jgi:membrane-bound serine protease (ClpP class)
MDWPILIAILMFLGFIFLLLEIFVVPGFGPVGIAAIALLGMGVYLSWIKLNIIWGVGITLVSILSVFISFIILKKSGATDKFILGRRINEKSTPDLQIESKRKTFDRLDITVGESGVTISDLRPSGIGEFRDKRLNVIADGIYINRNTRIRIVRIEGNRVFVEKFDMS